MPETRPGLRVVAGGQSRAADPEAFVWVAANAGSGKTHVLVERLARILLAGTPPTRILCLTFTNAAAAEMANRLFARLARWSIAEESALATDIAELTGSEPDDETLTLARRLFPLALESPGGLKIHTIHAFCDRLLHRFALESGVSPHFSVIDERGQSDLIDEARARVMADAVRLGDDQPLVGALETLSSLAHDMSLGDLMRALVARRHSIAALEVSEPDHFGAVGAWLAAELGIDPAMDEATLIEIEFTDDRLDAALCARAAAVLATGTKTDQEHAARFDALCRAATAGDRYRAHRDATITPSSGEVRRQVMTKALREAHPEIARWIDGELARAEAIGRQIAGIATFAATRALLVVAEAMISAYQKIKAARGVLDYDDLIARAGNLLARSDDALWVLYKLDGGIDHILVDEAQDTSPRQWAIVRYLAEDMLAGASARPADRRTTFAVGDEKQSIFSFQGADPAMFAEMRRFFEARATAAGHRWDQVPLNRSFRSAPEILAAVDLVFADPALAASLSADAGPPQHEPHRDAPGIVEIWPPVAPDDADRPDAWTAPVDYVGPGDPKLALARLIAEEIAGWLADGRELAARGRPIRPGDIMILVRRRNAFADAVVRELKGRGVPVAGIDRMRLTGQIVVQDLMALGRFVILPEDDLSLAALIRSPLVGLDEDELFAIAYGRETSLWRSLIAHAHQDLRIEEAHRRLAGWLAMADQMPPFTFFARILAEDGNRRRIARRLGAEAADPIEEFLNAALAHERDHIPSLEGFLDWLAASEGEVKRDMDHGRDEVRVMTVHGAKGLEANIVILPDTCQTPRGGRGIRLVDVPFPAPSDPEPVRVPVWPRRGGERIGIVAEAAADIGRRAGDEHLRLLYVAMTRARDWLIVAGYDTRQKRPDDCWYEIVRRGLEGHLEETAGPDGSARQRLVVERDVGPPDKDDEPAVAGEAETGPPAWTRDPPSGIEMKAGRITPSRAGTEAAGDILSPLGEGETRRFSRGLAMHGLLEVLPDLDPRDWRTAAMRYLDHAAGDLGPEAREALTDEAIAVLGLPEFAPLLGPGARPEAAFAATIDGPDGAPLYVEGRVDRLAVVGATVHVVDYKTHRPAPARIGDVSSAHLVQMALYRAALKQVFSLDDVRASLLWTDGPRLMPLPDDVLTHALHASLSARDGKSP